MTPQQAEDLLQTYARPTPMVGWQMKLPKSFFPSLTLAACILYFVAIFSLFPGPAQNATVPAAPKNIALAICSLGLLSTLAWFAYIARASITTVRTYFSRMGVAVIVITVPLLVWYINIIIGSLGMIDRPQVDKLVAVNCALVVVVICQFIRGMKSMRSQWKTGQDVFEFVRKSRLVIIEEARVHDYAFYGGVMTIINFIGWTFRAKVLLLHISAVAIALIFPYICGGQLSRYLIVRRIFPNDAPLPAELQT